MAISSAPCRGGRSDSSLVIAAFTLLLLSTTARGCAFLLLVYNQPGPRFFLVPFEAREDGEFELVVCLVGAIVLTLLWESLGLVDGLGTFFLNCLWIASNASLIVTPLRFLAVTSSPSGKCRSIFLTGGFVRNFFRTSLSSRDAGEVFSFLLENGQLYVRVQARCLWRTTGTS